MLFLHLLFLLFKTVDSDGLVTSLKMAPGSNNDQFIWNQSRVKKMMQSLYMDEEILENEGTYYLLGKLVNEELKKNIFISFF